MPQFAQSHSCNLEEDTWTFHMKWDYKISTWDFVILSEKEYTDLKSKASLESVPRRNEGMWIDDIPF